MYLIFCDTPETSKPIKDTESSNNDPNNIIIPSNYKPPSYRNTYKRSSDFNPSNYTTWSDGGVYFDYSHSSHSDSGHCDAGGFDCGCDGGD